jgi:hypothetical protein
MCTSVPKVDCTCSDSHPYRHVLPSLLYQDHVLAWIPATPAPYALAPVLDRENTDAKDQFSCQRHGLDLERASIGLLGPF